MRKQWLIGGVVASVLAGGAAFAVMADRSEPAKASDAASKPGSGKPKAEAKADGKADAKGGDKGGDKAQALEFLPTEVVKPQLAAMPDSIEFSGPLVAPGTVVIRSKAAGTLLSLAVGEGSRVRAGQSLGQVDLEELRYRVAERQASVTAARAQLAQAERAYKANEDLAAKNFIASTALDSSRAAMESARGQLLAAQAQAETAQVSLRHANLVAPINGIVAKRHALPGEKLSPEQQVLTIVDLSKLELAGLVGTHEVGRLKPGMPVQVKVEGGDGTVQARIARIAPAAEPGTRSIGLTLELANPGETLRAGQYAVARVNLPDNTDRLTVPESAISSTGGQEQVWLIEQGALVRRIVTTGRRDPREGRVEVLQGLSKDAQVLAARFDNLREGNKAQIVSSKLKLAGDAAGTATQR